MEWNDVEVAGVMALERFDIRAPASEYYFRLEDVSGSWDAYEAVLKIHKSRILKNFVEFVMRI